MGKIILLINNPIFKWKFMRPGTEKRNISEENVDDLILASNEEIILNPHIYTRLTAIDFAVSLV
jgi:hypothetical protein